MTERNRVEAAIAKLHDRIAVLATEDASKLDAAMAKLDAAMAVDWQEHFAYQEQQARSHAMGLLSTGEAQIAYMALGEVWSDANGGWASGTDTATKVAVTQLMAELIGLAARVAS